MVIVTVSGDYTHFVGYHIMRVPGIILKYWAHTIQYNSLFGQHSAQKRNHHLHRIKTTLRVDNSFTLGGVQSFRKKYAKRFINIYIFFGKTSPSNSGRLIYLLKSKKIFSLTSPKLIVHRTNHFGDRIISNNSHAI